MASSVGQERAIALDLGGTRFRVAVGTLDGVVEWRVSRPTLPERGLDSVMADVNQAIAEALAAVPGPARVKGIAVGAPGPVDPWKGVLYEPPNLPGWDNVPIKQLMEARFSLPTLVANDANLAAVGEHRFGAGRGFSDVIYVTVSTGIGGGIITNNQLVLGHGGYAGEIGHMVIDMHGPLCGCGQAGCLEALASGTAIARRAREVVASQVDTRLRQWRPEELTAKQVVDLACDGDAASRAILEEAAIALGVGMVNLAHIFNPHRIIIGGGVSNAGPMWWNAMRETVRRRALASVLRGLEIVPVGLEDDAGLLGGIALIADL